MAGRRKPLRDVVEEPGFVAGRQALFADVKRWDEFWRGAEWGLAKDPAGFDRVHDDLWVILCEPAEGSMPRLRVYYSFDDDRIYLKWVERA